MLRVSYKLGRGFKSIINQIDKQTKAFESRLMRLGVDTLTDMKSIIDANRKRPSTGTSTLESNITLDNISTGTTVGWGVGNMDLLDSKFPGWKAVNYGSSHMVGKHLPLGEFSPGENKPTREAFRDGRWQKGDGNYSPIVTKPIPPMNYIDKTVTIFLSKIANLLNTITR